MGTADSSQKPVITFHVDNEHFNGQEVRELVEPLESAFEVQTRQYFRASAEALWLAIGFVLGAYGSGFFGQAGADTYNLLKERIKAYVRRHGDSRSTLGFEFDETRLRVHASVNVEDPALVDVAMDSGMDIIDEVHRQVSQGLLPAGVESIYFEWSQESGRWEVSGAIGSDPHYRKWKYDATDGTWS